MRNNYEERKRKRIASAERLAAQNEQLSESKYKQANEMSGQIPMGQPILVGHYSEKRDRNFREKIHRTYGQAVKAQEKAAYYEQKAEIIANNTSISSDDPKAIEKLTAKIEMLEKMQEFMKAANRYIRKKDKDGFLGLPGATLPLWEELTAPGKFGGPGYPRFSLSNNSANIRNTKARLKDITRWQKESVPEVANKEVKGIRVVQNVEANRIQLIFEGRISRELHQRLRKNGFVRAHSLCSALQSTYQRKLNGNGIFAANEFLRHYDPAT